MGERREAPRLSAAELSARLSERPDELALALLGEPNRALSTRRTWRYGNKGSLAVEIKGPKRGKWFDHERSEGSDALGLVQRVHGRSAALRWAREWLSGAPAAPAIASRIAVRPKPEGLPAPTLSVGRIIGECLPLADTAAAAYLAARGLSVPEDAPLHFHPRLLHAPTAQNLPALVAVVEGGNASAGAIHRTFLSADAPRKADVEPNKMMLGTVQGGAVRITPAAETLAVAEGIETALSIWTATRLATWAALSTSGLVGLELPATVKELIVCADNDASGAGLRAAEEAAARWTAEGRRVRIASPPAPEQGAKGSDFNDLILAAGPEAVRMVVEAAPLWAHAEPAEPRAHAPARSLRGILNGIPPHFRSEPMDAKAVSDALWSEVERWLDQSMAATRVRQEIEREQAAAVERAFAENPDMDPGLNYAIDLSDKKNQATRRYKKFIAGVRREAKLSVLARWKMDAAPRAPKLQIAAGAGAGKTEAIISAVAGRPDALVHFYVPSHALADGIAERCRARGVSAQVLKGRTALGPDGSPMCRKPRLAARLGELGLNVQKAICKNGAAQCEFYGRCAYMKQVEAIRPHGVLLMPHQYLTLPLPEGVPAPDAIVIDESPILSLLTHSTLAPADLGEPRYWTGGTAALADFLATCSKVREALLSGDPIKAALATHGLDRNQLRAAAEFAERSKDLGGAISPRMSEGAGLSALTKHGGSPRRSIIRLLRRLSAELRLEREQIHSVETREMVATIDETGEQKRGHMIRVHALKRPRIGPNMPLLVIDADADEEIGRAVWGPYLRHIALPVARNARVVQVADLRFSKSSLIGYDGMSSREADTVRRRLEKVKRFIRSVAALYCRDGATDSGSPRVLVVTNRPVRCAITGEDRHGQLPAGVSWEGATIASFRNIRGIDDWRDYAAVVIVGREQVWPTKAEEMARALYGDSPDPLNLTGEMAECPRGYRMADGTELGTHVPVLPDARAQVLHELVREREITQAIDRLRLVHRTRPAQVYILGSLPVDITVDRLAGFDTLLQELEIEAARRRWGGVLPLVPEWVIANEPAILGVADGRHVSTKTAQKALERMEAARPIGDKLHIYSSYKENVANSPPLPEWGSEGLKPIKVEFRLAGRAGRGMKALISPALYGGALLLERALGQRITKIDSLERHRSYAYAGWPRAWGPEPDYPHE